MSIDISDKSRLVPKVKPLPENMSPEDLVNSLLQAHGWCFSPLAKLEQAKEWHSRMVELKGIILNQLAKA